MTNEVIKRPSSEPVTIANNANQALYKNFREWREYASSLEEDVKNLSERVIELDEHSQDEKDAIKKEYDIHQEIYSKTSRKLNKAELEIVNLKSQLQQQALPVVPECVDVAIESIPDHYSAFEAIDLIKSKVEILTEENKDWLPVYNWLCEGVENQDIFALAFITGKYEVEKPQLFYLKNKIELEDVGSDLIGYLNLFLTNDGYLTNNINRAKKFTQSEIDSMETGSYEKIEVAE